MFVDRPLDAEKFLVDKNVKARVDAMADQIVAMHEADPEHAVTVSLNGAWGTGKSTYLKALEHTFAEDGCPVIHFEAWRYAMEPDIFLALLEVIYESPAIKSTAKGMLKKAMKLFGVVSLVGAEAYLKATLKVGLDDITKAFKIVEDEVERQSTLTSKAKKQLDTVVQKIREAHKSGDTLPPFILAIDDFDRLPPDTAYALLEKQKAKLEKEIMKLSGMLGNEKFVANASEAVVAQNRQALAETEQKLEKVKGELQSLQG